MKYIKPKKIMEIVNSNIVQIASQLILGAIFIYAGIPKILNMDSFSEAVKNYKIIPVFFVSITAFILPLIEVMFGVILVLNIKPKLAAAVLSSLLVLFILAIASALIRGIDVSCGCFVKSLMNPQASKSNGFVMLIRDILFLVPGLIIICHKPKDGA